MQTYAMHQDRHYRTSMHGRIKDGVLTTDPADLRFYTEVNSLFNDRPLKRARLQVTLSETGVIEGYLAGYTPVESVYDMQFGFRNAKNAAGEPGPQQLRLHTANGAARVLGYTCQGAYQSLYQHADADPDPQSGRCTSISTQYQIKAIPAFVVDVATEERQRQADSGERQCEVDASPRAFLRCCSSHVGGCGSHTGEPDAVGGPAVMRRLTESQYRASCGRHLRAGDTDHGSLRARVARGRIDFPSARADPECRPSASSNTMGLRSPWPRRWSAKSIVAS